MAMKKLDNRGWSFFFFFFLIILLLSTLLIVALLSNQFDRDFPREEEDYKSEYKIEKKELY